jgi:hypothetical protein
VFGLFALITINVVAVDTPLNVRSYAMRKGEYPPGTTIGEIHWDSHFTDLRVAITNPFDEDCRNGKVIEDGEKRVVIPTTKGPVLNVSFGPNGDLAASVNARQVVEKLAPFNRN